MADTDYIQELAGFVPLPGRMECSLLQFARRVRIFLEDQQVKPLPDNALIALLCDAARLGWENIELARMIGIPNPESWRPPDWPAGSAPSAPPEGGETP